MTRGKWVLLFELVGLFGVTFGVDTAPFSIQTSTNETKAFRACGNFRAVRLADELYGELISTSHREPQAQSVFVSEKRSALAADDTMCPEHERRSTAVAYESQKDAFGLCGTGDWISGPAVCSTTDAVAFREGVDDDSIIIGIPDAYVGVMRDDGISSRPSIRRLLTVEENADDDFDYVKWCQEQCRIGEGGLACKCDILP